MTPAKSLADQIDKLKAERTELVKAHDENIVLLREFQKLFKSVEPEMTKLHAERQVLVDALKSINHENMDPAGVAYGAMSIAREALKKVGELK